MTHESKITTSLKQFPLLLHERYVYIFFRLELKEKKKYIRTSEKENLYFVEHIHFVRFLRKLYFSPVLYSF